MRQLVITATRTAIGERRERRERREEGLDASSSSSSSASEFALRGWVFHFCFSLNDNAPT